MIFKIVQKYRNISILDPLSFFSIVCSFILLNMFLQVAFWIVKTDTPSRTSLGIITILSVTKIGFGGKTKPKVMKIIRVVMMGMTVMTKIMRMMVVSKQYEGGLLHRLGHLQHHLLRFHLCRPLRVCSHQLHWDVCSEVYPSHRHHLSEVSSQTKAYSSP